MALCSYDNELNTKYKYQKDLIMARETAEQKALRVAEEAKQAEEAEARRVAEEAETLRLAIDIEDGDDMNFLEAMELSERSGKLARRAWNKELSNHYVTHLRGHSKPSFTAGKHATPYTPSYEDAVANDWFNVEEEV